MWQMFPCYDVIMEIYDTSEKKGNVSMAKWPNMVTQVYWCYRILALSHWYVPIIMRYRTAPIIIIV